MYKFGTIVLIPFPFTDLTSAKLRPALIVSKNNSSSDDIIVAFITSKFDDKRPFCHFLLDANDRFFPKTGLKATSVVRFDKIATLTKKLVMGELGGLPPAVLKKMSARFFSVFGF